MSKTSFPPSHIPLGPWYEGMEPGAAVAKYMEKAQYEYSRVDDRELRDVKTGERVWLNGTTTKADAELKVMKERQAAEKVIRAQYDTAREKVRRSIAKPMPSGVREQIATMKQLGATPTEVEALQRTYADSYLAQRLIQAELMDDSTPGTQIMAPAVDDVLGELDHTESLALRALSVNPEEAHLSYDAQLVAKGNVTRNSLNSAEVFDSMFGGDK
ncbi:hypothetical protein LTH96_03080 [Nesterenkonia sp. LB17]|uniref:hypothetical protein n=1 Tax=Nesterenkonia sp. LB17 TaxID=2901230 RepID=UPI001F4C68FD|nr:hypothetical protein [Nesterenkonia sp. LB17]MCH8564728.1 hypothetical protein [Nesterenkonia sp. LB17]